MACEVSRGPHVQTTTTTLFIVLISIKQPTMFNVAVIMFVIHQILEELCPYDLEFSSKTCVY